MSAGVWRWRGEVTSWKSKTNVWAAGKFTMEILADQTDHRAGAGQGRASPQDFINKIIDFYFQSSPV